jgi:hypothetical protein
MTMLRERTCQTCLFENSGIGVVDCDYCYGNMDTLPRWEPAPFWTAAERAGLKAMGQKHIDTWSASGPWDAETVAVAIRAFVRAALKVKERT